MKKLFLLFLFVMCVCLVSMAQQKKAETATMPPKGTAEGDIPWVDDPLKRPELWRDLQRNPIDSGRWVEYMGKAWKEMTMKDREQIGVWKQQLMIRLLAANEDILGFVIRPEFMESDFFIDDAAFKEMVMQVAKVKKGLARRPMSKSKLHFMKAELAGMEAIILEENDHLKELKSNIAVNFAMIEGIYEEIFKQFSQTYAYYDDSPLKKRLNQMQWIEEQERRLRDLKTRQIMQLRKKHHDKLIAK